MRRGETPRRLHPLAYRYRRFVGLVFIAPWLVAFVAFELIPTVSAFFFSLTDWSVISPTYHFVGLANFQEMLFQDPLFWKSFLNTIYYTAFSVPLVLVAAFIVALMLNARVAGRAVFRTLFYLPAVVPTVAASIVWLWILDTNQGILNYALGMFGIPHIRWLTSPEWSKNALILMRWWTVGGAVVIFLAGLQSVPRDLYEAAEVDGAGSLSRLRHVTVPMMTPTILFNLVMGMISSFQVFNTAFIMTGGGPVDSTLFYMLYLYENAFSYSRMGYASAMAVVLFCLVLGVTYVVFRTSGRWVHYT
jgi:multiple sugar transport system permease protein